MQLTQRFQAALNLAFTLHQSQVRKASEIPYLAHLLAVASIVMEHTNDEDVAIAALLHDAVEDQGGAATRQQISEIFGERVAQIVDGCTDTDVSPKPAWRARKQMHLDLLQSASPEVCLVCAADKLHNMRSILADWQRLGDPLWGKFSGGHAGTLWYYQSMAELLYPHIPDRLAQEVQVTLEQLLQLSELKQC